MEKPMGNNVYSPIARKVLKQKAWVHLLRPPNLKIWLISENKITRKLYVFAACAYSWFWLFREIVLRHGTDFEAYLLWFFLTAGIHFFMRDSKDINILYDISEDKKSNSYLTNDHEK